jgi:hypothetical protein
MWKRRRARKRFTEALQQMTEQINDALARAHDDHLQALKEQAPADRLAKAETLAQKVLRGDAHVLGFDKERGVAIFAERKTHEEKGIREDRVRQAETCGVGGGPDFTKANEEYWAAENARIDRAHHALRSQHACDEAPVTFGKQVAGGPKRTKVDDETCPFDHDRDGTCPWHEQGCFFIEDGRPVFRREWFPPTIREREAAADDGPVPPPAEVAAVMNAGMCDSIELLGETVLYRSDGRGGKVYDVPAVVTMVQKSHVDLPHLRAAEEANRVALAFDVEDSGDDPEVARANGWVTSSSDGLLVGTNPLPIPLDGTVHLRVWSPGEPYRELSVPYDPTGATPRSWRHRSHPF